MEYGFEVAARGGAMDPLGRLVAPSDHGIFYYFGESIVASVIFNIADWLRGNGGFVENVLDFGVDVGIGIRLAGTRRVGCILQLPPSAAARRFRRYMVRCLAVDDARRTDGDG